MRADKVRTVRGTPSKKIMAHRPLAAVSAVLAWAAAAHGDEVSHRYADGETVKLWANKVGPYNNPQETYNFFALPFCSDEDLNLVEHKWGGLGEVLEGNDLVNSGMDIAFKVDRPEPVSLCTIKLDDDSVRASSQRNPPQPLWARYGRRAGGLQGQ